MDDGSGRYLVYRLLHKQVQVTERNGKKATGEVKKVYRDVMSGTVTVTVGGREVVFEEPSAIKLEGTDVVFIYGRVGLTGESDNAMWDEVKMSSSGESLDDVLRRTAPIIQRETRFTLEPVTA
jgi:hypothetical protein